MRSQRPRTHAALMAAAVHLRFDANPRLAANVQGADALGAIDLVGREAKEVRAELIHVERNFPSCLGRVGVKQHPAVLADAADLGNRLERADLVVGSHHAHEDGALGERFGDLLRCHAAETVYGQVGHVEAIALQPFARVQHGLVLRLHRDDVVAARP